MSGGQQRQRGRSGESPRTIDPVLERAEAPALAGEGEALEQHGARDEVVVAAGKRTNVLERSSADGVIRVGDRHSLAELAATRNAVVEFSSEVTRRRTERAAPCLLSAHTDGRRRKAEVPRLRLLSQTLEASKGEAGAM